MLSVYQIQRHFQTGHFDPLLRGVAPIGMALPLPLQVRLSGQPAAVIALALKRVLELTYGPTALSRELTAALLDRQNADGSFGEAASTGMTSTGAISQGDPLATASAIAALGAREREHASAPHPEAAIARERAIAALAYSQADDGLFHCPADRTDDDRAMTGLFILSLLAGDEEFHHAARTADLMTWLDEHADEFDHSAANLWRIARIDAPAASPQRAAVAAIAA